MRELAVVLMYIFQRRFHFHTGIFPNEKCGLGRDSSDYDFQTRFKRLTIPPTDPFVGMLPWMVSLGRKNDQDGKWVHSCGGSIIGPHTVLTCAHCSGAKKYGIYFELSFSEEES